MSTSLPPQVLRRALIMVGPPTPPARWTERDLQRVAEALEEQGYLVVARADIHALRAAADKVLRYTPGVDPNAIWCGVSGCTLSGIREHSHRDGPVPSAPR